MIVIIDIFVCEILDSCGNLIVEVDVMLEDGIMGCVVVFLGVLIGVYEVVEKCDGDKLCYMGKGVLEVVSVVNGEIVENLIGEDVIDQIGIDCVMIDLDGIYNKGCLGVNVILGVLLVVVKVVVEVSVQLFYCYVGGMGVCILLVLMMNIINGGEYVDNLIDIQEFMIMLVVVENICDVVCMGLEVFYMLKKELLVVGLFIGIGDEGGFVLNFFSICDVLDFVLKVIEKVGYCFGDDIMLVLDCVLIEYFKGGKYEMKGEGKFLIFVENVDYLKVLCDVYLILLIEDGCLEDDWEGWKLLIDMLGDCV